MSIIRVFLGATALAIVGLSTSGSQAGEPSVGKEKAQQVCQTCHGLDGISTGAMVPHLSGQPKEYLVAQLQAFRDGKREHAQMTIIAQMLSDEDIENLSEWYSSIGIVVTLPE